MDDVSGKLSLSSPDPAAWQTIAAISTAVGVVVAIAAVITTLILTLRSEKLTRDGQALERKQAESTAARSEAAAALTEEYTRRVVDALETVAHQGGDGGSALAPTVRSARWSLTHQSGDTYLLTNVGEAEADDVEVTAHKSMILRPPGPQTVAPSEALTFVAARSLATSDSTITVRWMEGTTGEAQIWKYPLPPRPRRT